MHELYTSCCTQPQDPLRISPQWNGQSFAHDRCSKYTRVRLFWSFTIAQVLEAIVKNVVALNPSCKEGQAKETSNEEQRAWD